MKINSIASMQKTESKNLSKGAIIDHPGSTAEYKTGAWRNQMPILDKKKCQACFSCANFCPENCIKIKKYNTNPQMNANAANMRISGASISHIDYFYCKGCGICAHECPNKAIAMKEI